MDVMATLFSGLPHVAVEVAQALAPIMVLFAVLQLWLLRLPRTVVISMTKGMILAFVGFTLFLQGVQVAFFPVGLELGRVLGGSAIRWLLIPIGFGLGFLATIAEPAVHILASEVQDTSTGSIRGWWIIVALACGVAFMVALGMVRVLYGINLLSILIPGYIVAFILSRWAGSTFTSIAFDSGGVATGPMTVSFVMAVGVGAADVMEGRSAVMDGFGLIALVALAPIISVMIMGAVYRWKESAGDNGLARNEAVSDRDHN